MRISIFLLLLTSASTAISAILQLPSSSTLVAASDQSGAIAAPVGLPLSNVSASPIRIGCDPAKYGQNLRVPSCKKAFRLIVKSDTEVIFADRASLVKYNVPLPYRIQSGDGLCYLQVILADEAASGRVSSTDFGGAAITMIDQCVVKYGYGGIVSQIGGDNKLSVIVSSYKPNVKCTKAAAPPWNSTVTVFANMLATKSLFRFGRVGQPDVDVSLPFYLRAWDGRAVVKIDSDGRTTTSSWYAIWEAVNAIAYMCSTPAARFGGKASKLGNLANINLELFDLKSSTLTGGLSVEGHDTSNDDMATT